MNHRIPCVLRRILPTFIIVVAICFAHLCQATAGTPGQGEWRQSLDGRWDFTIDPQQAAETAGSGTAWDSITVPGNWDTLPKYYVHSGCGWYRRDFTVPADWKGRQMRLRFEAVYHKATVTLNGQELGTHIGGYTPFEFDVTGKLNIGGTNTVVVCADNTYKRGAWWPWGGISRSVNLIANNHVRIVWQHIRTEPNLETGTAKVVVRYKIANAGDREVPVRIVADIGTPGTAANPGSLAKIEGTLTVPAKSESIKEVSIILPKKDVTLWHFDRPVLYTLSSEIEFATSESKAEAQVLHSQTDRFGIRKIAVTPEGLWLNGERIRVPGFNRVSDSLRFGNTEPDELVKLDIDMMKRSGCVFMRIMHSPQAPNLLDYLDERGMLIFCEIPVWGNNDPQVSKDNPLTKQWLKEMVERDYNHPCIIGWSPGNEITGHYNYVVSMNEYIRTELDPHRLAAYVSYSAFWGNMNRGNDPVTVSDIAMINGYGKADTFAGKASTVRAKWPEKPVFYSEFGAWQIGAKPEALVPGFEEIWRSIASHPYVIGGALWTFNDYRNSFKDKKPSGNREWGVVDVDRRPKAAYWQVRKGYSPVNSISVVDGSVSIGPRTMAEVPAYKISGYRVTWKLLDSEGKETARGDLPVPDLEPGAPVWTAPIPGAKGAAKVNVSLVTPTGYDVDDNEVRIFAKPEPAKAQPAQEKAS